MPRLLVFLVGAGALALLAVGCTTQSSSSYDDPTTRALSDPMNYSPSNQDDNITGGGITNFDSDAFKKDVNHVVNP